MAFILYKLEFSSGKSYIGQTIRKLETRIKQHRAAANRGSMLPVHCAWRLYGDPNAYVIGEFKSKEELNSAEVLAIKEENTLSPDGYNVSIGGDNAPSLSKIVAEKISEKAKGRKHKDTSSWSKASKIQWQDNDYREKVISSVKSSWTPEKRAERSEISKKAWAARKANGYKMSEETKNKLRNKVVSEETRIKMSESAKKRVRGKRSEEHSKKLSESTKSHWASMTEDERNARVKAMKEGLVKSLLSK